MEGEEEKREVKKWAEEKDREEWGGGGEGVWDEDDEKMKR